MDRNTSIISIPDSDTSTALDETFSPEHNSKRTVPPVTPKREPGTPNLDATFTPEDKKEASPKNVQNETFSPVKEPQPPSNKPTPRRQLPSACPTSFDSPQPNAAVPEIVVVPPTAERRPLRRSVRTPSKAAAPEPVATRASTRRSTRQTPVKAAAPVAAEKKRGRRSKKEKDQEAATVEMTIPVKEEEKDEAMTIEEEEVEPVDKTIDLLEEIEEEVAPKKKAKKEEEVTLEETNPTVVEEKKIPMKETKSSDETKSSLTEIDDDDALELTQPPMFGHEFLLPKSIRKRSLSVADVPAAMPPKRNFRVQFHSPGNMEKTITEIDESLYLNFTKSFASSFSIPTAKEEGSKQAKPARRKRSLSNAETPVDKLATIQLLCDKSALRQNKEKPPGSSATKKLPTPSPRKKMPNFAAIHQNIFQQMESLVDFKERKKERAQFLLNPVSPGATATVEKATIVKPVNRGAIGKANKVAGGGGVKKASSSLLKPKNRVISRKPAILAAGKMSEKKLAAILQTADEYIGMEEKEEKGEVEAVVVEPMVAVQPEEVKENLTGGDKQASRIKVPRVYSNKDSAVKQKPQPLVGSTGSAASKNNVAVKTKETRAMTLPKFPVKKAATATALATTVAPKDAAAPKAPLSSSYKIVKGVRMNRRFDLLMKHRTKTTTDKN